MGNDLELLAFGTYLQGQAASWVAWLTEGSKESQERGETAIDSASNSDMAWHLLTGFLVKDRSFALTWHCLVICSIDLLEKRSELHFNNNQLFKEKIGRMPLFEHKPSSWTTTKRIPQNWYGFYCGLHAAILLQAPLYLFKFDPLQSKCVCLSETEIKVMILKQQSSFWFSFRQSQKDEHICEYCWWETIQNEITENNLAGLAQACHGWPEENSLIFLWNISVEIFCSSQNGLKTINFEWLLLF